MYIDAMQLLSICNGNHSLRTCNEHKVHVKKANKHWLIFLQVHIKLHLRFEFYVNGCTYVATYVRIKECRYGTTG